MKSKIIWNHGKNDLQEYFDAKVKNRYGYDYLCVMRNQGDNIWTASIENDTIMDMRNDQYGSGFTVLGSTDPEKMMCAAEFCYRHHIATASLTDQFNVLEWLKSLLLEGEAIAQYTTVSNAEHFCIVPDDIEIEQLDISECLEETLHHLLDAEEDSDGSDPIFCSYSIDTIISMIMGADTNSPTDDEGIEIDRGYRIHDQIATFKRLPRTAVSLEKELYERYKLIWMLDDNITLQYAFSEWRDYCDPANGMDPETSNEDAFERWEDESGFSGSLYPCFDEFVQTEYCQNDDRLIFQDDERRRWELDQEEVGFTGGKMK